MSENKKSVSTLENGSSGAAQVDVGRIQRSKRKQAEPTTCCPVCSITVRPTEIDSHLMTEVHKLMKLPTTKPGGKTVLGAKNGLPSGSSVAATTNVTSSADSRKNLNWETYQKVKSNRTTRQKLKSRKRKVETVVCPICNVETSAEDIQLHVEICLRRSEDDQEDNIDVEGGEYEEYEWAGQSRVRATTLLEGGVCNLGTTVVSMSAGEDEEEDLLVVDGDDTQIYGSPQYSERDVIVPGSCDKRLQALRKAVTGSDGNETTTMDTADDGSSNKNHNNNNDDNDNKSGAIYRDSSGDPVVSALKNRIRELETREQFQNEVYKCLICMERYQTPVISVCCWHVHCEKCWLQTLGAKKLCPQCNMITSPGDLRRIYM